MSSRFLVREAHTVFILFSYEPSLILLNKIFFLEKPVDYIQSICDTEGIHLCNSNMNNNKTNDFFDFNMIVCNLNEKCFSTYSILFLNRK